MFQLKGRIYKIFEVNQITEKFRKRPFVLEVRNNGYTEYIQFDLLQGHCHLIDQFNEGDEVIVFFQIQGRKWESPTGETKYFNTLSVWQIVPSDSSYSEGSADTQEMNSISSFEDPFLSSTSDFKEDSNAFFSSEEDPNDLPF